MKVLVTGGTGFLGSHIVRRLLDRGDDVRVVARHRTEFVEQTGIDFTMADICDVEKIAVACRDVDAVIHTAAHEGAELKYETFLKTNVYGTKSVVEGCRRAGVRFLIATSSPSVVDPGESLEGVDETCPYPKKSLSYYAKTKRIAEEIVLRANSPSLLTCAIRPRLIWGPGDKQLIPRIIARARRGHLYQIGKGDNLLDITYVENAADAHLLALNALQANPAAVQGNAYFISQGEPVNCWSWVNKVLNMAGIPSVKKTLSFKKAYCLGALFEGVYAIFRPNAEPPITRFLATQLSQSYWFNIEKARRDLKYQPQVSTEEGEKRLMTWLRSLPPFTF